MALLYDDGEDFAANDTKLEIDWSRLLELARRIEALRALTGAERRVGVIALLRELYGPEVESI